MIGFKLTGYLDTTTGFTKWGERKTNTPTRERTRPTDPLCTPHWVHFYKHPLQAVFFDPIHGGYTLLYAPHMWVCLARGLVKGDGTKYGGIKVTSLYRIPLPYICTEHRLSIMLEIGSKLTRDGNFIRFVEHWRRREYGSLEAIVNMFEIGDRRAPEAWMRVAIREAMDICRLWSKGEIVAEVDRKAATYTDSMRRNAHEYDYSWQEFEVMSTRIMEDIVGSCEFYPVGERLIYGGWDIESMDGIACISKYGELFWCSDEERKDCERRGECASKSDDLETCRKVRVIWEEVDDGKDQL